MENICNVWREEKTQIHTGYKYIGPSTDSHCNVNQGSNKL